MVHRWGVGAENASFHDFVNAESLKSILMCSMLSLLPNYINFEKNKENLVFVIMSIMENVHLVSRTPLNFFL